MCDSHGSDLLPGDQHCEWRGSPRLGAQGGEDSRRPQDDMPVGSVTYRPLYPFVPSYPVTSGPHTDRLSRPEGCPVAQFANLRTPPRGASVCSGRRNP